MISQVLDTTEFRADAVIYLNTAIAVLLALAFTYEVLTHGKALIRNRCAMWDH